MVAVELGRACLGVWGSAVRGLRVGLEGTAQDGLAGLHSSGAKVT